MRVVDIIAHKRDGSVLSAEEIDVFVQGPAQDAIPDHQAAAWLMAILLRGIDRQETIDLPMAIVRSGEQLDLSDVVALVVDKHSTWGVGDKKTFVAAPLVTAAGVRVAKLLGRGLGLPAAIHRPGRERPITRADPLRRQALHPARGDGHGEQSAPGSQFDHEQRDRRWG